MLECGEQWAPFPAVKRVMAASIPGVACRTLIDSIPVLSAHRQKATQNSLRQAPQHCRHRALRLMRRRRESAPVTRWRFCVRDDVDDAIAPVDASPARAFLVRHCSCLGRRVVLFATRRIGKEATTPARRSFREMRLIPRGSVIAPFTLTSSLITYRPFDLAVMLRDCCELMKLPVPLPGHCDTSVNTNPVLARSGNGISAQHGQCVAVYIFLES